MSHHPELCKDSIGQSGLRADEIRDPRKLSQLYGGKIRINPPHSCHPRDYYSYEGKIVYSLQGKWSEIAP